MLETTVNRAAEFVGTFSHTRVAPSQLNAMAIATLATIEAMQQVEVFVSRCYEVTDDNQLVYVMPGGQIPTGVWCPWGGSGKSRMPRLSRDILRVWLRRLHAKGRNPLWYYMPEQRRWYVDFIHYPGLDEALTWLKQNQMSSQEWLSLSLRLRPGRQTGVHG